MTVDDFLKKSGFLPDDAALEAVVRAFDDEASRALAGERSSLRMINSFLPGSVCAFGISDGPVIVVDAGGTNLRVAVVRLTSEGPVFSHLRKSRMPGSEGPVTADEFHRAIAAEVDAVRSLEPAAACIGYCFSYECRSLPNRDAELVAWSKQIAAPDVIGQRVGAELVSRLSGGPLPVVVLNDTVATLLAGLSQQTVVCPGQIGFILGTGTNLACIEEGFIRNAESGECDKMPTTDCDAAFDAALPDTGAALFEKMVAGAYLGGVALTLLKRAAADGVICAPGLAGLSMLSTPELDAFAFGDAAANCPLTTAIDPQYLPAARKIAEAVLRRAALFTSAHIAAFVRRYAAVGRIPIRITVDGSTYWKIRSVDFDGIVGEGIATFAPGVPFEIFRTDEAPMVGAAVAAAALVA